jgi:hypothetical protein
MTIEEEVKEIMSKHGFKQYTTLEGDADLLAMGRTTVERLSNTFSAPMQFAATAPRLPGFGLIARFARFNAIRELSKLEREKGISLEVSKISYKP